MTLDQQTSPKWRSVTWLLLKWALFACVAFFVSQRAISLWGNHNLKSLDVGPGWLALAAVAYLIGWLPSVFLWRAMLHAMGGRTRFLDVAAAYYCGHLGKYIPGKATVLVIRASILVDRGSRPAVSALTATYETLVVMTVGVAIAVALSPHILNDSSWQRLPSWLGHIRDWPVFVPCLMVTVTVLLVPVSSRLLTWLAIKTIPRSMEENQPSDTIKIKPQLIYIGIVGFVLAWMCHGLSLGFTIRAVTNMPIDLTQWPLWTGGAAFATAVGFFCIFAPGGLGVREGLLIEALRMQPGISEPEAVAVSIAFRIVWLVTEICISVVLYSLLRYNKVEQ